MSNSIELEHLVATVRESTLSDFYRMRWGSAASSDLPTISRDDLRAVPLSKRRYKNEKGIVKIVRDERGPFLSEWSFTDIGNEAYGIESSRPMVYLSDPHDAIEKALWCYEQNMLPLLGEKDPEIAGYAASKYQIDSLITDAPSLVRLRGYLESRKTSLACISVLGSDFDTTMLSGFTPFAERIRLILALPETGAFAGAELADDPRFAALPACIIEKGDTLILTKLRSLTTPIIGYDTGISGVRL